MKKNILKYAIVLVSAVFCFSACDDQDFLTEKPETFYTIDNIFTSSEQVDQLLTSCYRFVRRMYCPYNNSSELDLWSYTMGNGTDIFDVPTIRMGYRFNDYSIINPEYGVFNATFTAFYKLISLSNTALSVAGREGIVFDDDAARAYATGQARFFRAFAYRNLAELFGGVPLVTEMSTAPRYDYERATRMETYQYAIDEMEAIMNDFPVTTPTAGQLVRAAVQHNLCQLYIDKGVLQQEEGGDSKASFNTALSYANAIIDGGTYKLMTERFGTRKDKDPVFWWSTSRARQTDAYSYANAGYPIEGNLYWDLFQVGNQDYQSGNTEAIWCAQGDMDVMRERNSYGATFYYPGIYGPVFRDQGGSVIGGTLQDVGGTGMCQITPTTYARDLIYEGKWGDDLRNSDAVFRRTFLGNRSGSEYYGKLIPWDVLYKVGDDGKWADAAYTLIYPISCKIGPDWDPFFDAGYSQVAITRDDYLIRLPETILLRAEIKWRLGDNAGAAEDINMLRRRAQCGYLVTASDVSVDLILDERARELIYEESRWNTLLRMGGTVATDRIKKYSYWDYPRTTLNKTLNLWPIPQKVIDTNKDVPMAQNPGW